MEGAAHAAKDELLPRLPHLGGNAGHIAPLQIAVVVAQDIVEPPAFLVGVLVAVEDVERFAAVVGQVDAILAEEPGYLPVAPVRHSVFSEIRRRRCCFAEEEGKEIAAVQSLALQDLVQVGLLGQ